MRAFRLSTHGFRVFKAGIPAANQRLPGCQGPDSRYQATAFGVSRPGLRGIVPLRAGYQGPKAVV